MALLEAFGKWVKAKDKQAARKIEDNHIVDFAEQDLDTLRAELEKAITNCGMIKARMLTLNDDIKAKSDEITTRTDNAKALLAAGKEDLAMKQGAIVEGLEKQVATLKDAYKQQEELYNEQEANKNELQEKITQCEISLGSMKTLESVKESNESLTTVNTASGKSALASFEDRERRLKEQTNAAKAIRQEHSAGTTKSLDEQTAEALGKKPGSSFLEKLKAEQAPKT
jgi:phage shock protein A